MVSKITESKELNRKVEALVSDSLLGKVKALSGYSIDDATAKDILIKTLTKAIHQFEVGEYQRERAERVKAESKIYLEAAKSQLAGRNFLSSAWKRKEAQSMTKTDTFRYYIGVSLSEIQGALGRDAALQVAGLVVAFDSAVTIPQSLMNIAAGLSEVARYEPSNFKNALESVSLLKSATYAGNLARKLGGEAKGKSLSRA